MVVALLLGAGCGPRLGGSPPGGSHPREGVDGRAVPQPRPNKAARGQALSPTDHLRLASAHRREGRCGAVVFHLRMALRGLDAPGIRQQAAEWTRECQVQGGWAPPPVPRGPPVPLGPGAPLNLSETVLVPGGVFQSGSGSDERKLALLLCGQRRGRAGPACFGVGAEELPAATASLSPFALDRTEVSWGRYLNCVRAGACSPVPSRFGPPKDPSLPVVGVNHGEAARYCRFVGGRLPTDAEWEQAGRGHVNPPRIWPWGHHAVRDCARHGSPSGATLAGGAAPVGTTWCDASPYGVLDLAGNVREWAVRDPKAAPPPGRPADSNLRPVRGGSYRRPEWEGRVAARSLEQGDLRSEDLGFRCARDTPRRRAP